MDGEVRENMTLQERMETFSLNVSEMFYSIEGEGIRIGQPTLYIRVIGCPHRCTWCDTPYSIGMCRTPIKAYNKKLIEIQNFVQSVIKQRNITKDLWIENTGGSPDWFIDEMGTLMEGMREYFKTNYDINVHYVMQISGGIFNPYPTKYYTSEWLLTNSDLNAYDYKPAEQNIPFIIPLNFVRDQDEIKFLIKDQDSYQFVKQTIHQLEKSNIKCKFIITTVTNNCDEGIIEDHLINLKNITEKTLNDNDFPKSNIKILPREHILLWGNKKGV